MQKILFFFSILMVAFISNAQPVKRPKLVVGIVVDQMRWDYLYRYYDRYSEKGGFKRMIGQGFTCENTMIPYAPTVTACGHASIYTGSVPGVNGITGNIWYDNILQKSVYCTEDASVQTVGSNTTAGLQSPRNMFTNTIGDELRLATNFKSKVIAVALKDRGSILPGGHSANAAYWFDSKTGDWITSSFYMKDLPGWLKELNAKKMPDQYYRQGWSTMYPVNTYTQSTPDENKYEAKPFGADAKGFPYNLSKFAGSNYSAIASTPFGDDITIDVAKAALINEQLGKDDVTDLLAVSFSSTDYVGHAFGPNSIEAEDIFLRLDKQLGELLDFFDEKVGKDQYTVFLSADHGAAHAPLFVKDNKMPAGYFNTNVAVENLNNLLKQKFGKDELIVDVANYQVFLNIPRIDSAAINVSDVKKVVVDFLSKQQGVQRVFSLDDLQQVPLNAKIRTMIGNGYYPERCGHIQIILQPQWIEGFTGGGTTHGSWNPYDAHIPLLWYGYGIKHGRSNHEVYMTDIAPTLAGLLQIQMPNGSVGNVISEVLK